MTTKSISIKETRDNLAEIIERVATAGENYIITKFNKPKAIIIPYTEETIKDERKRREKALAAIHGIWKSNNEILDSVEWVKNIRQPRYGKIFN